MEIQEVTFEDAGLYRMTLENDYGRIEATARLDVISNGRHGASRDIRTSSSPRKHISVSRRIMGNSTKIGGRLVLATNFRGGSVPSSKFYHNGSAVEIDNKRVRMTHEGVQAALIIENTSKADEGIYTCLAEDGYCLSATSTSVNFSESSEQFLMYKPEFVQELETCEGREGVPFIDLRCMVDCEVPFDIKWKHDGKIIKNADKHW